MAEGRFVAYYRVSTQGQGRSGLGLEAQRKAVQDYLDGGHWSLIGEFTEIESGKRSDRPKLAEAMRAAKRNKATLVIAKLDRLAGANTESSGTEIEESDEIVVEDKESEKQEELETPRPESLGSMGGRLVRGQKP